MTKDINLNLLKHFYEVANYNNITKASEALYISQPALTKSIKLLESQLKTKLLTRSKTGVGLTKEGEVLYDSIKDVFSNLNSTFEILATKTDTKVLYIGTSTTNFIEPIMSELNAFRKLHPDVQIDIKLDSMSNLEKNLKLDKLDIVIKNDYENITDFKSIKVFKTTDKFVASRQAFGELSDRVLSLDDVLSLPLALLSPITHGRRNFDNFLKQQNVQIKPRYEFDSYSICKEIIRNGFGVGIGNPIHYNEKDFIILNTDFELPSRTFEIGYIKSSKNKIIQDFLKLFN